MQLFYQPEITAQDQEIIFDNEESRHIARVLRKKTGDFIMVTDGNGLAWQGKLKIVDQRKSQATLDHYTLHTPKKQQIHLAIAPTKSNDRMAWFLEKATEIGISSITPLLCHHSERKTIKLDRMEKILISALKQSQQYFLPKIHPMVSMTSFINNYKQPFYIAHCDEGVKTPLLSLSFPEKETTVLIGPEGDFSADEIALSQAQGGIPVTLGENRLRTETAGIVALSTVVLKQRLHSL